MNDAWKIIYPHWRGHTRVTVNVKHETVYLIDSKWAATQQSKRREIPFPSVESVHLPKSCPSSNRKKEGKCHRRIDFFPCEAQLLLVNVLTKPILAPTVSHLDNRLQVCLPFQPNLLQMKSIIYCQTIVQLIQHEIVSHNLFDN
jgi:hypothetical protein